MSIKESPALTFDHARIPEPTKWASKASFCSGCPLNDFTHGYVPPVLNKPSTELYVGEAAREEDAKQGKAWAGGAGTWFGSMCRSARINRNLVNIVNTIGCHPPENIYPLDKAWKHTSREVARAGVEYCAKHHLNPAVHAKKWSRIVVMGERALNAVTPRQGIFDWRGSALPLKSAPSAGLRVMATLDPAYIMKDAKLFSVVVGDLKKALTIPPENYNLFPTLDEVKAMSPKAFAFDFEWDRQGNVTLFGITDEYFNCTVVPFENGYIPELKRIAEGAELLIGHNIIGAEYKYFEQWGWNITGKPIDTMLIQHLVQPDYKHGLGFVASVFTNKPHWKGRGEDQEDEEGNVVVHKSQWQTWNTDEAIPRQHGGYGGCNTASEAYRLYNARDTDASFQCAKPLENLLNRFSLEHIYWNISVPAAYLCRDMGDAGLRIDNTKVVEIREKIETEIAELEQKLPDGLRPFDQPCNRNEPAPAGTYKTKTKKCKGSKKLGTQHPVVEIVFTDIGTQPCPDCGAHLDSGKMQKLKIIKVPSTERIIPWNSTPQIMAYAKSLGCKDYIDNKTKKAKGDKKARKVWGRTHTEFTLVDVLKRLATQKNSFAKPGMMYVDKLYFNLLVHGTSEGRLSSSGKRRAEPLWKPDGSPLIGKDGEQLTITDPNIQNQPKIIRDIFIPDRPGWGILNLDIVQGENMLTAWLAQDHERLTRLNTPGYDEHSELASRCFNVTVNKDNEYAYLRQVGKKINHARNYGMGANKMQAELAVEGYNYSLGDCKAMIEAWRELNPGTAKWQDDTIKRAEQQGYLVNAFGRKRWFTSRDFATKALAFLPASTLADCVLRMMIAIHADRFQEEVFNLRLERTCTLPQPWRMCVQVHDSIMLTGPEENHKKVAEMVKSAMEQPWRELDGYALKADVEWSTTSWGKVKKLEL